MPVVFTPLISVKEIYDIVGYVKAKGLRNLESMKMIDIGISGPPASLRRTIIKTNDFETMRDGLVTYAAIQGFTKKKELCEKFEKELGTLKVDIDNISALTSPIYQEFMELCKENRGNAQILLNDFMASKRARESIKPEVNLDYHSLPTTVSP